MGDSVSVPAFGEHGYGNDTADVCPQGVRFADRIDDFAQQVGIGELLNAFVRVTLPVIALEAFNFGNIVLINRFVLTHKLIP